MASSIGGTLSLESQEQDSEKLSLEPEAKAYTIDPETAGYRAEKYAYALSPLSPDREALSIQIQNGLDSAIRQSAASQEVVKDAQRRQLYVEEYMKARDPSVPASDEETELLVDVMTSPGVDPETVMEKLFAKKVVSDGVGTHPEMEGALKENTDVTDDTMFQAESVIAHKEVVQKKYEELEAKRKTRGWLDYDQKTGSGTIVDIGEQLIPWRYSYNISNALTNAPTTAWLPGNNVQEQINYFYSRNIDVASKEFNEAVDKMAEDNLYDAIRFVSFFLHHSQIEQVIDNVIPFVDVATVTPLGAVRSAARSVAKAAGYKQVTVPGMLEASGKNTEAALALAKKQVETKLKGGSESVRSFEAMAGEAPAFFQPELLFQGVHGDPLVLEQARRIQEAVTEGSSKLMQAIFTDPVTIQRLGPEALERGLKETERLFKAQYPDVENGILRVRPITSEETQSGAQYAQIELGKYETTIGITKSEEGFQFDIGKTDATLFDNKAEAFYWADDVYKLGSFKTEQVDGGKWVIRTTKPIDESSLFMREIGTLDAKKEATPRNLTGTIGGFFRGANVQLPGSINEARALASVGQENIRKVMTEVSRPIGSLSKQSRKDFERFTNTQKIAKDKNGEIGRFSKNYGMFEQEWSAMFGKLPTEAEHMAYWTYQQLNDMSYSVLNVNLIRDLGMTGHENFFFKAFDEILPGVQGKFVDDIPLGNMDLDTGVLILGDTLEETIQAGKNAYMRTGRNKKKIEELLAEGYKIVELSRYGKSALRENKDIEKFLLKDRGRVEYILSREAKSTPLDFKVVPYRAGGHVEYKNGFFARQANVKSYNLGNTTEFTYYGDRNVAHFDTLKEATTYERSFNIAREMLRRGAPDDQLKSFLENNLPHNLKQFKGMFSGDDAYLDVNEAIHITKSGESVDRKLILKDRYARGGNTFVSINDSPFDTYKGMVNLKWATERDDLLRSVVNEGSPNQPLWNFKNPTLIDPVTTMERSASAVAQGRYLEDLKHKSVLRWVDEFGKYMGYTPDELARNPYQALTDPKWRNVSIDNRSDLAAAKNFRRATLNFLGVKGEWQKAWDMQVDKAVQAIYTRAGEPQRRIPDWAINTIKDPSQYMKNIGFHAKMGFFNVVQLFKQGQQAAFIAAVEGPEVFNHAMVGQMMRALKYTTEPKIIQAMAKRATKWGDWTEQEFMEAYDIERRLGFSKVGREFGIRDDYLDPSFVEGKVGRFLEIGLMPFNQGEKFGRHTAINTAYKKWRAANPGAPLNDAAIRQINGRATMLIGNMTRAGNAAWQKGVMGIPTQFMAYQARLADLLWGKELTGWEKARVAVAHTMLYGAPVAAAAWTGAVWPAHETIKNQFRKQGINADDNAITQALHDGIPSMIAEYLTGTKLNVGESYGPSGTSIIKDLWEGDKDFMDFFKGVLGSTMGDAWTSVEPFYASAVSVFDGDDDTWYPLTGQDFANFFLQIKSISTFNNFERTMIAFNTGQYISKHQAHFDNITPAAAALGILGLQPQSISDSMRMFEDNKSIQAFKDKMSKSAIEHYRLGMQEITKGNKDTAADYFRQAKAYIVSGKLDPKEVSQTMRKAFNQHKTLTDQARTEFLKNNPKAMQNYINSIRKSPLPGTEETD